MKVTISLFSNQKERLEDLDNLSMDLYFARLGVLVCFELMKLSLGN